MQLQAGPGKNPAVLLVTLIPLVWLLATTLTAGYQKIFNEDPRIGFLAQMKSLDEKLPALQTALEAARQTGEGAKTSAAEKNVKTNRTTHFNNRLDAVVAGLFMLMVAAIACISVREWILLLARKRAARLQETEPVWLPAYAIAEAAPLKVFSLIALAFALLRELSGEAHFARAEQQSAACLCDEGTCRPVSLLGKNQDISRQRATQVYVEETERRYKGVNRCC
jgi:carbon starvation protein